MGAKRNNKNYPWTRDGYAKDPTKTWHQDGWCQAFNVFKKQWDKFPLASCTIIIRNFNKVSGSVTIEIKTPFKVRSHNIDWDRLYYHRANLANFFPKEIIELLKQEEKNSDHLSAPFLIKIGDLIATALGRELLIIHQEGGDPAEAEFTNYGPFKPNEFKQFPFDPKETFGTLNPQGFRELDLFGEE